MFLRKYTLFFKDEVMSRVVRFSFILFFVFLGDAVLSFWAPNLIEETFGSALAMGLIISFSNVVGLGIDLILPQIIKNIKVRRLLTWAVFGSVAFALNLLLGLKLPYLAVFLLAMVFWGIYYEFFGFAAQQFVADSIPLKRHSSSWAILGTFKSVAYLLGPLIAVWVLLRGEVYPGIVAILFSLVGFVILTFYRKEQDRPVEIDTTRVNLISEIEHWYVLFRHVWPLVVLGLFMGLVDSAFWTTGAIWTETLAKESFWGGMFLPAYQLPALFMGLVVVRWGIYRGKKKMAEIFLLLSGLFLVLLGVSANVFWQLAMVFISSAMLSVTYPMVDATYSDIVARMGTQGKHLMGLSSSTLSLGYIVGPALAGFIAQAVGERMSFVVFGVAVSLVSAVLLLVTPKKLKLPHGEIQSWKK